MATITAKQLKQKTGEVIRGVRSGERLTVTHRGKPVAVIFPPPEQGDDLPGPVRPLEEAWPEIEAPLEATEPKFKNWREAVKWAWEEGSS